MPPGAVPAGKDLDGGPIFVGRAYHQVPTNLKTNVVVARHVISNILFTPNVLISDVFVCTP